MVILQQKTAGKKRKKICWMQFCRGKKKLSLQESNHFYCASFYSIQKLVYIISLEMELACSFCGEGSQTSIEMSHAHVQKDLPWSHLCGLERGGEESHECFLRGNKCGLYCLSNCPVLHHSLLFCGVVTQPLKDCPCSHYLYGDDENRSWAILLGVFIHTDPKEMLGTAEASWHDRRVWGQPHW